MLLMLEDDADRLARFAAVLRAIDPTLPLLAWRDAHAMIGETGGLLTSATLISLDHDLEAQPGARDPGDGYLVAQWLVSQPIVRPVIISAARIPATRRELVAAQFQDSLRLRTLLWWARSEARTETRLLSQGDDRDHR